MIEVRHIYRKMTSSGWRYWEARAECGALLRGRSAESVRRELGSYAMPSSGYAKTMIVDKLNEWYATKGRLDTARRYEERGGFTIGPSNLGDCSRKLAFLLSGIEPLPLEPHSVRTFELGHQRGEALERACKEIWPDAESQVPIQIPVGKYTMHGTCDLWIPSLRTVVDFKTQAVYGFTLLDQEGPSLDYQLQIHAYRHGIGSYLRSIKCIIIYEAKDSDVRKGVKGQELKEVEVPWSDELEETYQGRLRMLELMLRQRETNTLNPSAYPELPVGKNGQHSWKCRFCSIGEERGSCYKNVS